MNNQDIEKSMKGGGATSPQPTSPMAAGIIGAVLGTAATLILTNEKTRNQLKAKMNDAGKYATEQMKKAVKKGEVLTDNATTTVQERFGETQDSLANDKE